MLQLMLRTHGFDWYCRHRMEPCADILHVRIQDNHITAYHTFDSDIYKTSAIWTRIRIPVDLDTGRILVHIMEWPPQQVT